MFNYLTDKQPGDRWFQSWAAATIASRFSWIHLYCHPQCYKVAATAQPHFFTWQCPSQAGSKADSSKGTFSSFCSYQGGVFFRGPKRFAPVFLSKNWTPYPLLDWALAKRDGWTTFSPVTGHSIAWHGFISREEAGMTGRQSIRVATMLKN